MEIRKIDLDGIPTRYIKAGESGETIVFLHGGTPTGPLKQSSLIWDLNLPALGQDFCTLAPDLLGMGETQVPSGDAKSIEQMIKHARSFVEMVCRGTVHLVGHDEGGLIALSLAYALPERISTVTLIGTRAAPMGDSVSSLVLAGCPSPCEARSGQEWLMERMSFSEQHIGNGAFLDDAVSRVGLADRSADAAAMRASISREKSACFAKFRNEGFPVPIQLIWGLQDRIVPIENALALYELLLDGQPSAQFRAINRAGNFVFRERMAEFNEAIRSFIGTETLLNYQRTVP